MSDLETKYVFPRFRAKTIISWLNGRVAPDKQYPAGIVSSIYYDSRDWNFLDEKKNSDYLKSKMRLRWYLGFDTAIPMDESYVEIKYKAGLQRKKTRLLSGLSGKFLETADLDHMNLLELPYKFHCQGSMTSRAHMVPTFLIRYRRLRYIEPATGTRISVDFDIHVPKINPMLKLRSNLFKLDLAVLEIKGNGYNLPDCLSHLIKMGCRKQSFSKYLAGYRHLTGDNQ
jgi:hypothetical protein